MRTRRAILFKLLALLPISAILLGYLLVNAQAASIAPVLKACSKLSTLENRDCQIAALKQQSERTTPASAMGELISAARTNDTLAQSCHAVGHSFGLWAYEQYQRNAVGPGLQDCGYGYYHGLIEGAALVVEHDQLADTARYLCEHFTPRDDDSCAHGVGHAMGETFTTFSEMLQNCERFDLDGQGLNCFSGATMIWGSKHLHVQPAKAASMCSIASEETKIWRQCFMGSVMFSDIDPLDVRNLIAFCATLDDFTRQEGCYYASGYAASTPGSSGLFAPPLAAAAIFDSTCGPSPLLLAGCHQAFATNYLTVTQSVPLSREMCSHTHRGQAQCRRGIEEATTGLFTGDTSLRR